MSYKFAERTITIGNCDITNQNINPNCENCAIQETLRALLSSAVVEYSDVMALLSIREGLSVQVHDANGLQYLQVSALCCNSSFFIANNKSQPSSLQNSSFIGLSHEEERALIIQRILDNPNLSDKQKKIILRAQGFTDS